MVTECSLLPHTALCYHTLQKVINNRSMPYTKAAFQAPGSGDLTNSLVSPLCRRMLFPGPQVGAVAVSLGISTDPPRASSLLSGIVFVAETPFAFTRMRVGKAQTGLVPSVRKRDRRGLRAEGCKTFPRELKKPRENDLIWVYT